MKVSKYNFFYPYKFENNKFIAYNSLVGSLALITKENMDKYNKFKGCGIEIDDKYFLDSLIKQSFLLDDDVDETQIIKHNMYCHKFNTNYLNLTIAPTSDCNFKCIYCFEKNTTNIDYMDNKTIENIIKFVKSKSSTINLLSVCWYGGEPLLAISTIKMLSDSFIDLCKNFNIKYTANMISNGYNLTQKNIDILKQCNVNNIQITIDGDKDIHNKRRPLKNGDGTFDKIINNLINLRGQNINIALRINVDNNNCNQVFDILDILYNNGLQDFVFPYLARVFYEETDFQSDELISLEDFFELNIKFKSTMLEKGYTKDRVQLYNYPVRKNGICSCDSYNSFVIDADGSMCKCYEDIGKKDVILGNINDLSTMHLNKYYLDSILFDPTSEEKCMNCSYMPICMGGCPNIRKKNIDNICNETKLKLEEKLNYICNNIKVSQMQSCNPN